MINTQTFAEISVGNKSLLSANSTVDIITAVKNNLAYAKYFAFGAGDNVIAFKEATLNSINCDISKGKLFAQYSAGLSEKEFVGDEFSFFGLSYDGTKLFNKCEFVSIVKTDNEELRARITVSLTLDDETKKLVFGGNNPLIEFLLGAKSLGANVKFYESGCNMLKGGCFYDFDKDTQGTANVSFLDTGLEFNLSASPNVSEVILTIDDKPILRHFVRLNNPIKVQKVGVGFLDYCGSISDDDSFKIVYCEAGTDKLTTAKLRHNYDKLYKVDNYISYNVGKDAVILGDTYYEYIAIGSAREVIVYETINNSPMKLCYRVNKEGDETFSLMADGYVAIFGKTIKIYSPENTMEEYDIESAEQNIMVNEDNNFHYANISKDNVYTRYKLLAGKATVLFSGEVSSDAHIFEELLSIGIMATSGCELTDSNTVYDFYSDEMDALLAKYTGIKSIKCCGCMSYLKFTSDIVSDKIVSLDASSVVEVGKNDKVKLYMDFASVTGNDTSVYFFNKNTRKIEELSGKIDSGNFNSFCRLGEYLIAVGDSGTVDSYYLNRSSSYLFHRSIAIGDNIKTVCDAYGDRFSNVDSVNVKFTVEI